MADYMPAAVEIGGDIPADVLPQLIRRHGLCRGYDGPPVESLADEFAGASVTLANNEAAYGRFEELEHFLVEQEIPFDRESDGKYEFEPEVVKFRPGMGEPREFYWANNEIAVPASELAPILDMLRSGGDTSEAANKLAAAMGADIPPVPAFRIIGHASLA